MAQKSKTKSEGKLYLRKYWNCLRKMFKTKRKTSAQEILKTNKWKQFDNYLLIKFLNDSNLNS